MGTSSSPRESAGSEAQGLNCAILSYAHGHARESVLPHYPRHVGPQEEPMSDPLQSLMAELEQFGTANDSATTERSRRMLNITHF